QHHAPSHSFLGNGEKLHTIVHRVQQRDRVFGSPLQRSRVDDPRPSHTLIAPFVAVPVRQIGRPRRQRLAHRPPVVAVQKRQPPLTHFNTSRRVVNVHPN